MRIKTIHVQRFRSIYDATMECESLTALVGANGAGKSSFLRALEVFYKPKIKIFADDFYNRNTNEPIIITVTYCDLSQKEQKEFRPYYRNEQLQVEKRITWENDSGASTVYHGFKPQHKGFTDIRTKTRILDVRSAYQQLRNDSPYKDLPALTTGLPAQEAWEEFKEHLVAWEEAHPSECTLEASSTQFFGVKEVGTGLLEKYTQFVMVPAVRDASADGEDARGSVISQLIDMVVRNTLAENQQVCQIKAEVADKLGQIPHLISLDTLNSELNTTMQRFTPNTAIALSWKDIAFQFQDPQVDVQLEEDGYNSYIHRSGHGVQRAFIMTMLQHLATNSHAQKTSSAVPNTESDDSQPTVAIGAVPPTHLIFAIEEPELFQHPSRQRHFAHVLHELAHGKISGVASSTQVLYCTHSPLFVDIDQFENIRLIRKTTGPEQGEPQQTTVKMTRLQNITPMNHHKLSVMLTPAVNEGFFARRIIVVEGEGDKAYLQMVARYCFKESLEAHGITIISVDGVGNLEKPLIVFPAFGIPVYPVWDNDKDNMKTEASTINRKLLSLCGCSEEDWPEGIHDTHAIFSPNLEAVIEAEVTQEKIEWTQLLSTVKDHIGGAKLKNHAVVSQIVKDAYAQGCRFPFASQIIEKVMALEGISITPSTASITATT